ncbi:MAG: glycosyl hydrolase [Anaerocolumna sp.]
MKFDTQFKNPGVLYRIKPFWFWNGELKEEMIRHQIEEMKDKGIGGFFICARQGMDIPYMSKRWTELVEFACLEGKRVELEVWLYDEYPYPSGMAGGEVLLKHPDAGHMILKHHTYTLTGGKEERIEIGFEDILYAKAIPVRKDGTLDWDQAIDVKDHFGILQTEEIYQKTGLTKYNNKRFFSYGPRQIFIGTMAEGIWKLEIYTQAPLGDFKYFGNFFDPCNKEAVSTFLACTHEKYEKQIGREFGTGVLGMFSDEVGFLSPIPWSKKLPDAFMKRNGYDLIESLPALHNQDFKDAYKLRYDLYETAHLVFRNSYHEQISSWCTRNHLMYATEVPSMRMSTQKYSHVIGGDTAHEKLGKSLEWIYDEYFKNYRSNERSVASLARQLDKKYAMIESFHSVGWTMTLQDAKWMIDRLGSSGINLYNFHAFYYTIEAITKHDAPPSQFLQNPYWKYYRNLADYVGRMGAFVSNTEAVTKVAVLDPVISFWTALGNPFHSFSYKGEDKEEGARLDQLRDDWVHLCKMLLFNQISYDHLDSEIMKDAIIENGIMILGRARYSTIIIPPSTCMETYAKDILEEFAGSGGHVIILGMLPAYKIEDKELDFTKLLGINIIKNENYWRGEEEDPIITKHGNVTLIQTTGPVKKDNNTKVILDFCRENRNEVVELNVDECGRREIVSSIRQDEEGNIYVFAANQGKQHLQLEICNKETSLHGAEDLSLENGRIRPLDMKENAVAIHLKAYESRCIRFVKEKKQAEELYYSTITISTAEKMKVSIEGYNCCRLGELSISKTNKNWVIGEAGTIIEQIAETSLLKNDDFRYKSSFGIPKKISIKYPFTCYYRNIFEIADIPNELYLMYDRHTITSGYKIKVNQKELDLTNLTDFRLNDQNNQRIDILKFIIEGENELLIQVQAEKSEDGVRDSLYLLGNFSVKKGIHCEYSLCKKLDEVKIQKEYIESFPFYSGTFTFETSICINKKNMEEQYRLTLDIGEELHDTIEVTVNHVSLGVRSYAPNCWYGKTKDLNDGSNGVVIHITNTLANMLDGTYFDYDTHHLIKIKL